MGIANRDIKLENTLLMDLSERPVLKLCDFGYSKDELCASISKTMCGEASTSARLDSNSTAAVCRTTSAFARQHAEECLHLDVGSITTNHVLSCICSTSICWCLVPGKGQVEYGKLMLETVSLVCSQA